MITAESRYADRETRVVADGQRGTLVEIAPALAESYIVAYTGYRMKSDDRLDILASRLYGDSRLWWIIADANPEILDFFANLTGVVLRIPDA